MKPIARMNLLDSTVKSIKEYILSGELSVGDKMLTETELCTMLGVGRSTVREALKMIQTMGYLEMRPGKGSFVARTQEADGREKAVQWFLQNECEIREVLEFRLFLEPYVTHMAAERITDGDLAMLDDIMASFERAYYANDIIAQTVYDKSFHSAIVGACRSKMFIGIYDNMMQFLNNYFAMSFSIQETARQSLQPHQRILAALRARDAARARAEMQAHINLTISNMLDVVAPYKAGEEA